MRDHRTVVVVGEFDGFHLGHRWLVHAARRFAARKALPLVAVVLDDGGAQRLTEDQDRELTVLRAGAHAIHRLAVSADSPAGTAALVANALVDDLRADSIVMACPTNDSGTRHPNLRGAIRSRGVELVEVERWRDSSGAPITTAAIVRALRCGDVARAAAWLGEQYRLSGEVVHGSALGRTIGFPTANVRPPTRRVLPANGVYAGTVGLPDGRQMRAAINVGVRPTVCDQNTLLLEAHLLNFDGDLYGSMIKISFHERLRNEARFETLDALVDQLRTDVECAELAFRS